MRRLRAWKRLQGVRTDMWKRLEHAPEKVREQRVVFYQTLEALMLSLIHI